MYLKRKYQVGGIAYTPYLAAQAGISQADTTTSGTSSGSSTKSEKVSGTMKKEIIDLLKENGLPSDVAMLLDTANSFLMKSQALHSASLFGGDDEDYSLTDLISIQKLVNDVKYNNGLRNSAVSQINKEGTGSEVAITSSGLIYAYNKDGNIVKIKPSEYKEGEHQALTNNELLYLRERDNNFAFRTDVLNDMSNSVGMESIVKYLRDSIKAFGKETLEGYATKSKPVDRGLQLLMEAGPDGYYLFTKESQLDKTDRNAVNQALRYLYNGMSDNAKHLIRAKAAVEGGDPSDPNDISNLLLQALYIHTDSKDAVKFDKTATEYDPQQTGKKGGSSNPADQLTQNNYLQRVGNLRGDRTIVSIAPRAAKISDTAALTAPAFSFGMVIDRSNKPVDKMSLTDLLKEGWAFAAGEPNDVVFGNKLLKSWERDAIMFDDNSNLSAVMLPYINQGGHIVPDFEKFDKFNKLQEIISNNLYISPTEFNSEARKLGINPNELNYDQKTNTITFKDTMAFLTVSGYAGSDTLDLSKDNKKWLEKIDRSDGQHIADFYNNMVKYGKLRPAKKGAVEIKGYSKSEANDFWRGNIFIPMKNAFNAMNLSGIGEFVQKEQEMDFYDRVAARAQETAISQYLRENDPNYAENLQIGQFKNE